MNFVGKNIDGIATILFKNILVALKIISNNRLVLSIAALTIGLYLISSNAEKRTQTFFLAIMQQDCSKIFL